MHKDVYGTPNSIFSPTSQWLHQYMQQWLVTPVVNWEWMLTKYFWRKISNETSIISNLGENLFQWEISQTIIVLQKNPSGLKLEELVSQTGLWIEEVMSELTMAEVMGEIRNDAGIWKVV
jgi:predicted Rossmann fold nucleotide-binding protein DprA/Smf involved in DNA uptake